MVSDYDEKSKATTNIILPLSTAKAFSD